MTICRQVIEATTGYPRLADLGKEPHEPKGILNSEMAAVIATSTALGVDTFIESGRARGHSTLLLAKHLAAGGVEVHSFDRARDEAAIYAEKKLAGLLNLHLHYGDSRLLIPDFVCGLMDKRIALLIDGPKDRKAIDLVSDCLLQSDGIVVAFVHDLARLAGGAASRGRAFAERWFDNPFFTDDAEFVEKFGYLDEPVFAATKAGTGHWQPYHNGTTEQASYGPTLGVIIPTGGDRERARQRGLSTSSVERLYFGFKDRLRRLRDRA